MFCGQNTGISYSHLNLTTIRGDGENPMLNLVFCNRIIGGNFTTGGGGGAEEGINGYMNYKNMSRKINGEI